MAGGNPDMQTALLRASPDTLGVSRSGGGGAGISSILNALEDPVYMAALKAQLNQEEDRYKYQLRDWETNKKNEFDAKQSDALVQLAGQLGVNLSNRPNALPQEQLLAQTLQTIGNTRGISALAPILEKIIPQVTGAQAQNTEMTGNQKDFSQLQQTPDFNQVLAKTAPAGLQYLDRYNQLMASGDNASAQKLLELVKAEKNPENVYNVSQAAALGKEGISERGKRLDAEYGAIGAAAKSMNDITNQLQIIDSSLGDSYTGAYGDTVKDLQGIAQGLGISQETLAGKEAGAAIANALALKFRDPAAGGGMPGSLSDTDRKFLESMTPGLLTSPQGRKKLIQIYKGMADRANQIAEEADIYAEDHDGKLDAKWARRKREILAKQAATPILKQEDVSTATSNAPIRVQTIEEARALPPGTKFIDPNGTQRIR